MKNVFKVLGVIALVAIIGFTMTACGGGSGGDDDDFVGTWISSGGQTLTCANGKTWTARFGSNSYKGTYDFNADTGLATFTITFNSGSGGLGSPGSSFTATIGESRESITITASGGTTYTLNQDENPFIGTWKNSEVTVKCTATTWEAKAPSLSYSDNGQYAFSGSTAYFISNDGSDWGTATVSDNTMTVHSTIYNGTLTK